MSSARGGTVIDAVITAGSRRLENNGALPAARIRSLVDEASATNLHGQAWAIADKRVAMFRTDDITKRAALESQLRQMMDLYRFRNGW